MAGPWDEESATAVAGDVFTCPPSGPTLDDCSCTDGSSILNALEYGRGGS